jgi:hypothetical protein
MMSSRGMGNINPSKMPGKKAVRRKPQDMYAEGGGVNAAGNYTKPSLRKRIVAQVKAAATHGTGAGQWSSKESSVGSQEIQGRRRFLP